MNIGCVFGRHAYNAWQLFPRVIGARVEWLRWESRCQKCRHVRRRWFKVAIPDGTRIPKPVPKAISAEQWLRRIGTTAPGPETLQDGSMPHDLAEVG
jgi:hypothetical protein